ncbi:hypothetical protein [Kiloniella sp.]|uniref:hypothetical protein n=1 Tax=Kiloniella sp. TaxID=1938587 RepID=UPI003A91F9A0
MPGKPFYKGKPLASLTGTLHYCLSSAPIGAGSALSYLPINSFHKALTTFSLKTRPAMIQAFVLILCMSSRKTVNEIWA